MTEPDRDALATLPERFAKPDPDTLATLPKGGANLLYMGHAEVTLALLEADPCWTWEPLAFDASGLPMIDVQGNRLTMWGYLTVCGLRRLCVGTCEARKGDPEKELIGDLLRNGAMRFGIGTKLWSKATEADPASSSAGGYKRGGAAQPAPASAPRNAAGVTDAQIKKMQATFTECGIKDRAGKLAYIAAVVDREVESSKDLTKAEAVAVINALEVMAADLAKEAS